SNATPEENEIRNKLLLDAISEIGACSPDSAAEIWARGVKERNAAKQFSVMTQDLKDEYLKQVNANFPNWVTGVSSPWIDTFIIIRASSPDKKSQTHFIWFDTVTSTGPAGKLFAIITVSSDGEYWRITQIESDEGLIVYTGYNPDS
ncbi:MAG TPA: hypothetical protein PLZ84_06695, partial [Clostridia bacterium]|nr:hypothetical protein [Clostridia bacterium]